jgi:ABC-2 type transport system permease protein
MRALSIVVGFLGQPLGLPNWLRQLSTFEHAPSLPPGDVEAVPLLVLTVIAGVLVAGAIVAFRQRDVGEADDSCRTQPC